MNPQVNINFDHLGIAFKYYVRSKALLAGSNLVYKENNQIIKENPRTGEKEVIKITIDKGN